MPSVLRPFDRLRVWEFFEPRKSCAENVLRTGPVDRDDFRHFHAFQFLLFQAVGKGNDGKITVQPFREVGAFLPLLLVPRQKRPPRLHRNGLRLIFLPVDFQRFHNPHLTLPCTSLQWPRNPRPPTPHPRTLRPARPRCGRWPSRSSSASGTRCSRSSCCSIPPAR